MSPRPFGHRRKRSSNSRRRRRESSYRSRWRRQIRRRTRQSKLLRGSTWRRRRRSSPSPKPRRWRRYIHYIKDLTCVNVFFWVRQVYSLHYVCFECFNMRNRISKLRPHEILAINGLQINISCHSHRQHPQASRPPPCRSPRAPLPSPLPLLPSIFST
jgi:hypothetical protein